MEEKIVELYSYWGVPLKNKFVDQNSDVLAVIIPGIGYTLDRSVMDYSRELVIEKGYDVLGIEFGFQVLRKSLDVKTEFNIMAKESGEVLNEVLNKKYKRIIFIGKSVGTEVQNILGDNIKSIEIVHIYLTPVDRTVEQGIKHNSLVITGSKDHLITRENVNKIRRDETVTLVEIEGADHSLNHSEGVMKSIETLQTTIKSELDFLDSLY
ncbi:alpha/beta family hydrolase [Clostridium fallax]|uniref:Predicted hydrolase of the alpha/beta-hydrolase fold n=1 Tax=Clostridium fallax TaxID=1533 RepID=A0A1M4XXL0_9CLOT|nr:alpha/beta family hydrolase [Clostridium fallax]SHE98175.1 Predicted hydrolase of the alpha/beta-hydrolase fold [Clostridium fallax]SQB06470.1 Alpha/beta hydrolase family [Clostridium fallax]